MGSLYTFIILKFGRLPMQHENGISNSSFDEIEVLLSNLNNQDKSCFQLNQHEGTLTIAGGNNSRVIVVFSNHKAGNDAQWGKLIDPTYLGQELDIDISINGEINPEPLYLTVSKQMAYEVISYFIKNRKFPQNLMWKGDMSQITG